MLDLRDINGYQGSFSLMQFLLKDGVNSSLNYINIPTNKRLVDDDGTIEARLIEIGLKRLIGLKDYGRPKEGNLNSSSYYTNTNSSLLIHFHETTIYINYTDRCPFGEREKIVNFCKLFLKREEDNKRKINFVIRNSDGRLILAERKLDISTIPVENYDLSFPYEDTVNLFKIDSPGLILFSGPPGTGKSYFIRHLVDTTNKKFVYISTDTAAVLSDPSFISFALENLSDCVLVIEDAECVLVDRQKSNHGACSTILNITDGIFGSILNTKILATINVDERIDSALLRKGRLLARVNFNPLNVEKSNKILARLGKQLAVTVPTTLGDLYHLEHGNGSDGSIKQKIGF